MAAKQLHTNREMKSNKKDENNHKPPSAYFNAQTSRLPRCRQSCYQGLCHSYIAEWTWQLVRGTRTQETYISLS